jgi:hypothetical protein
LFERSYSHHGSGSSTTNSESADSSSNSSGNINTDRESLIRGLQRYGGIKTIIQELSQEIDELRTKKKDLDEQNQKMLSILVSSKPIVEFLNRSDNDYSLSADNGNVKILAMIATTLFLLYIRHFDVGKLLLGEINELAQVPQMATAAAQGEAVSILELKTAIAKAFEILITKSDAQPQTSKDDTLKDMT